MNGNAFEQMKNGFLVELERCMPGLEGSDVACILGALERAAFPYEVQPKEVALTTYVDPVPQLLRVYLAVKKTEGLAAGTLENYKRILTRFFLWVRKQPAVLRHTTATTAVNAGMPIEDVSRLLGHASLNTTLIYAKVATNRVQTEHLRCVV